MSSESIKYIEDIQVFVMNMPFISSLEVKKCIFHFKYYFVTSQNEFSFFILFISSSFSITYT